MPEFDPIGYIMAKYQQAKQAVADDPELSTYADIAKSNVLPSLKAYGKIAEMGGRVFEATSPVASAASGAGNPNPQSGDMLGQFGHVPNAHMAEIREDMLSAGGKRIYSSLKSLAQNHDWAQKAVDWLEGPETHPGTTANILNPSAGQNLSQIPGVGPVRQRMIGADIHHEPLPETQFSSVQGGKGQIDQEAEDRAAALQGIKDFMAKRKAEKAENAEAAKQQWAQEPAVRKTGEGWNNFLEAMPGGGQTTPYKEMTVQPIEGEKPETMSEEQEEDLPEREPNYNEDNDED